MYCSVLPATYQFQENKVTLQQPAALSTCSTTAANLAAAITMISLTNSAKISLFFTNSNDSPSPFNIVFQTNHKYSLRKRSSVAFRTPKKQTWSCSATDQPQPLNPHEQPKFKKKQPHDADKEKGIDPVGFLTKHGISHKAFAFFLRER